MCLFSFVICGRTVFLAAWSLVKILNWSYLRTYCARYMAYLAVEQRGVIPDHLKPAIYPKMAQDAMQGEAPGSSAGGEQPKFTSIVEREDGRFHHVIVKFSPPIDTASGRRWADLLIEEHLALEVLAHHGIAAATTAVIDAGGRIFLEVVRFDRTGLRGRRPMVTLATLNGDLGMLDRSWSAVARELGRTAQLPQEDIANMEILDLYGALIGNTDKHQGNIAFTWTFEQQYRLLDAYDMLPMLYRPNAHGEIVAREWDATSIARHQLRHLDQCYQMAQQFWAQVQGDRRISDDFKAIAQQHMQSLARIMPGA